MEALPEAIARLEKLKENNKDLEKERKRIDKELESMGILSEIQDLIQTNNGIQWTINFRLKKLNELRELKAALDALPSEKAEEVVKEPENI